MHADGVRRVARRVTRTTRKKHMSQDVLFMVSSEGLSEESVTGWGRRA